MSWVGAVFWFVVGAVGYRGAALVLARARPERVAPPPVPDRGPGTAGKPKPERILPARAGQLPG